MSSGKLAALRLPLVFDPGEKWEYGINIDWVGRLVEEISGKRIDAYCRDHLFAPLGMADTGFVPSPEQRERQAVVHQRLADGIARRRSRWSQAASDPEFWGGGGAALFDCRRLPAISSDAAA